MFKYSHSSSESQTTAFLKENTYIEKKYRHHLVAGHQTPACTQLFYTFLMSHILTCLALRALSRKGTVASCRQEAKISMAIVFCRCIQQGVVRSHRNESWDLTRDSLPRRSKVACSLFEELISNVQTILLSDFKNNSIEAWKDFMYIHLYRVRQELVFIMLKSIISLKTQRLQSIQLLKNTMYGIALMILDHPLMSMMR